MRGGRRRFGSVGVLVLAILAGCGGDRGARAPAGDMGQIPAASDSTGPSDSVRSVNPDTGASAAQPGAVARDSSSPQVAPPRKPATPSQPKPAAPAPQPAVTKPSDAPKAAAPAAAAPASPAPAEADAPLRDAYHQAPLDTVAQQVYDGWKQFSLNCARCHGEDVQGTTIAPHLIESLKPDGTIPTKELFIQTVCAGRPEKGMPSWCQLGLEMDKIESMYFYVKGRSEGKIHLGRPAVR